MSKVEDIIAASKLSELMNKKEEDKHGKTVLWILALVGAVTQLQESLMQYIVSSPRIIWKISKTISMMMISTMTFSMMTIRYKNRANE